MEVFGLSRACRENYSFEEVNDTNDFEAFNAQRVELGSYSDWIRFSDHMPLICEIQ